MLPLQTPGKVLELHFRKINVNHWPRHSNNNSVEEKLQLKFFSIFYQVLLRCIVIKVFGNLCTSAYNLNFASAVMEVEDLSEVASALHHLQIKWNCVEQQKCLFVLLQILKWDIMRCTWLNKGYIHVHIHKIIKQKRFPKVKSDWIRIVNVNFIKKRNNNDNKNMFIFVHI